MKSFVSKLDKCGVLSAQRFGQFGEGPGWRRPPSLGAAADASVVVLAFLGSSHGGDGSSRGIRVNAADAAGNSGSRSRVF